MDSFQSVLGDAAGGALCSVLSTYGSAAPALTAIALWEPTPIGEALATTSYMSALAANSGCSWDPSQEGPSGSLGWTGCREVINGPGHVYSDTTLRIIDVMEVISITATPYQDGRLSDFIVTYKKYPTGAETTYNRRLVTETGWSFVPKPGTDAECGSPAPGPEPIQPSPEPYIHTDPTSGCEISVTFQGWGVAPHGTGGPVWLMEPAPSPQSRNSGGVIGGCNFAPTIYYDDGGTGGGGGCGGGPIDFPVPDPVPPDGDEPWWAGPLRDLILGATGAAVEEAIEAIFEPGFPAGSYVLEGVCERDSDGNPMDVTRSSTYTAEKGIAAVLTRLDAIADLFQFSKELRQPICRHHQASGDLVTVNFVSELRSPQGQKRLRKQLRYRDQGNSDLFVHGAHWRDFVWEAGPVCVCHKDGPWGVLQVWALTAEEGRRVIAHAGAVAGVDPDSEGEWIITGSKDPRYGQPGTMRVERRIAGPMKQPFLRVTKRSDPNGMPMLPAE